MVLDAVANFVRGNTDAAVDNSQTTISVSDASIFPDPATEGEYNVVIWDATNFPRPDQDGDVEILRVTAIDTGANDLTVTRAQETTTAAAHPDGSAIHLSPTAKMFSDIESEYTASGENFDGEGTSEFSNLQSVSTEHSRITHGASISGDAESGRVTERGEFVSVGFRGSDGVSASEGFTVDTNGVTAVMGGTNGLNVFDVSDGVPTFRATSANTDTQPYGVKLDGPLAVCANFDTDSVTLVDVSEQTAPNVLDTLGTGGSATLEGARKVAVDREQKRAYVSASKNTNHALTAIDYSGRSLSVLWSVTGSEFERAFHVATSPNWPAVYVAAEDGSDHVVVVDKDAESIATTFSSANTDGAYGVALNTAREELYVTANDAQAFSVWDVSSPLSPSELGSVSDANLDNAYGLAEESDYAYVAAKIADSYNVIDKSDPTDPTLVTSVTNADHSEIDQPYDVAISQDGAFVANRTNGALVGFGGQNTQPYSGYSYLTSDFSVSAGATETIPFDASTRNDGVVFDSSTHEWVIPADGIYEFDLATRINDLPDGVKAILIMVVNGTGRQNAFISSGTESINTASVTFGRPLDAGDTVRFEIINEASISISLQGVSNGGDTDNTWVQWSRDGV